MLKFAKFDKIGTSSEQKKKKKNVYGLRSQQMEIN